MSSPLPLDPVLLRALAEPTRIDLLSALIRAGGRANVGTLAASVTVDTSVVSRHLRELHLAGVVRVERRGRERWYTIELDHLLAQFETITALLRALRDSGTCC